MKFKEAKMIMIYYAGLGVSFKLPEKIDLTEGEIISWQIKKLTGWQSPNLVIKFSNKQFEQPVGLIVNYADVVKWLKKHKSGLKT